MPFGIKPVCTSCKTNDSTIWRKPCQGEILCNSCASKLNVSLGTLPLPEPTDKDTEAVVSSDEAPIVTSGKLLASALFTNNQSVSTRKSLRLKPTKNKLLSINRNLSSKGKSRRSIFKKTPVRSATSVATATTQDYVFHNGNYYQIGDVVSAVDCDNDKVYYAQIRGILQDQYSDKSIVISWLIPTTASPPQGFDPASFILGPEEDLPRDLDYFEFVCHAPSDYFHHRSSPYPTKSTKPELGYIWTTVGAHIEPVPSMEQIFGIEDRQPHSYRESRLKKEQKEQTISETNYS